MYSYFCPMERSLILKRFNVYIPIELFERIKSFAKFYRISISKAMVHLLEIGYLEFIKNKEETKK